MGHDTGASYTKSCIMNSQKIKETTAGLCTVAAHILSIRYLEKMYSVLRYV